MKESVRNNISLCVGGVLEHRLFTKAQIIWISYDPAEAGVLYMDIVIGYTSERLWGAQWEMQLLFEVVRDS